MYRLRSLKILIQLYSITELIPWNNVVIDFIDSTGLNLIMFSVVLRKQNLPNNNFIQKSGRRTASEHKKILNKIAIDNGYRLALSYRFFCAAISILL